MKLIKMKQTCKQCGKNCEGEYCFQHKPRKALKSQRGLVFQTDTAGRKEMGKAMQQMLFFQEIWNKRPHKSEISGDYLGKEAMSTYFHHILPKEKYPEICLDEENIILLTLDEHTNVENDIYKYEEINKRREKLKIKHT